VRVGISLLTLAPSDLGGSETYARQLTRTLATVGTHEYTAFVPGRAKDAAGGLPAVQVRDTPAATRGPSRIPALAISSLRSREMERSATIEQTPMAMQAKKKSSLRHEERNSRRAI
jgi:hypothetical protein